VPPYIFLHVTSRTGVALITPSLRAYGWTLPVIILLGTVSSAAEAVGIGLFLPLLDPSWTTQVSSPGHSGVVNRLLASATGLLPEKNRIGFMAAVILTALLLKASVAYLNAILSARKNLQIGHELRCAVFSQLLNSGYAFVSKNEWGKLLDVLSTQTWRSTQALSAAISAITNICTFVVFGSLLLLISWRLTLSVTLGMLILSAVVRWITWPVKMHGEEAVQLNGTLGERMVDGLLGMRTIESFNLQSHLRSRFEDTSDKVRAAFMRVEAWSSLVTPCADISSSLLLLALVVIASGIGTPWPVLVVTVMMLYRLQSPFKQLESARVQWAGLNAHPKVCANCWSEPLRDLAPDHMSPLVHSTD